MLRSSQCVSWTAVDVDIIAAAGPTVSAVSALKDTRFSFIDPSPRAANRIPSLRWPSHRGDARRLLHPA
jgi:hypothetical protein